MADTGTITIVHASTNDQLHEVRKLVYAFVHWHKQRHVENTDLINEYFDVKAFEEEMTTLPGKYAKPGGSLLLAFYDNEPAGCVALRQMDNKSCEMKRMFVYERFHGKGVGKALAEAIIKEAKEIGYENMKLDTSFRQGEAQGLYQRMGFKKIKPYYELPKKLQDWLVFMELKLK
jgi:GNAT superfamily N-acetyltransferase